MKHSFEEEFRQEMFRSERTRMAILAGLFASLAVQFPLLVLVFREHYLRVFQTPYAVVWIAAVHATTSGSGPGSSSEPPHAASASTSARRRI